MIVKPDQGEKTDCRHCTGLAAKAATPTIPIIFCDGFRSRGIRASLSRPGANITGATFYTVLLGAKRLELLRELVPKASTIAVFANTKNPVSVAELKDVESAAPKLGLQIRVLAASDLNEIGAAFQTFMSERADALYISADPIFYSHRNEIAALATRHGLPAISGDRDFTQAGGLSSYGASRSDAYRQAGLYVGRILKGEKPSDLPVVQPTEALRLADLQAAALVLFSASPVRCPLHKRVASYEVRCKRWVVCTSLIQRCTVLFARSSCAR